MVSHSPTRAVGVIPYSPIMGSYRPLRTLRSPSSEALTHYPATIMQVTRPQMDTANGLVAMRLSPEFMRLAQAPKFVANGYSVVNPAKQLQNAMPAPTPTSVSMNGRLPDTISSLQPHDAILSDEFQDWVMGNADKVPKDGSAVSSTSPPPWDFVEAVELDSCANEPTSSTTRELDEFHELRTGHAELMEHVEIPCPRDRCVAELVDRHAFIKRDFSQRKFGRLKPDEANAFAVFEAARQKRLIAAVPVTATADLHLGEGDVAAGPLPVPSEVSSLKSPTAADAAAGVERLASIECHVDVVIPHIPQSADSHVIPSQSSMCSPREPIDISCSDEERHSQTVHARRTEPRRRSSPNCLSELAAQICRGRQRSSASSDTPLLNTSVGRLDDQVERDDEDDSLSQEPVANYAASCEDQPDLQTGDQANVSDVEIALLPASLTFCPSIPCECTALYALQLEDLERNRPSRQVRIIVPPGIREDNKVRVNLSNMEWELEVPPGTEVGEEVACDLNMVMPMGASLQRHILHRDILITRLRYRKMADGTYITDEGRKKHKAEAYRTLRGRCMAAVLSTIEEELTRYEA